MIGRKSETTVVPTTSARNTTITGSSKDVIAAVAVSTSSPWLSAIFNSISSAPVCSLTSIFRPPPLIFGRTV